MSATFGAAVDDFIVGEYRAELRAPVDNGFIDVGQPLAIDDRALLGCVQFVPAAGADGLAADDAGRRGGADVDEFAAQTDAEITAFEFGDKFVDGARFAAVRLAGVVPGVVGAEENPLGPLVVLGIDRRDFARPVVAETEAFELATEVVGGLLGGDGGVDAGLDRVLLGGKAEGIPAHGVQNVSALHAHEA